MSRKNDSSGFGIFIILVGIVLLLMNFNVLSFSMFWGVVKLWPLLFVVLGLSLLFRSSKNVGIILWLLFFGIVIAYSYLNIDQKTWSIGQEVDNILYEENTTGSVGTGEIDLDINHGSVTITSSDSNDITYKIPENGIKEAYVESKLFKSTLLKIEDVDMKSAFSVSNRKYEIEIPDDGKWALDIDGGVITGELDFSNVILEDLKINTGVLETDLIIGEKSEGVYSIDAGVGDINISIPEDEDLGVKIKLDSGLRAVDIDSRYFNKSDDTYTSENYSKAKHKIEININIGVGSVQVNVN